jgi:hypothetical protein
MQSKTFPSTTKFRPNLTQEERKIIQEVDEVIQEIQTISNKEKLCTYWLKKLDEAAAKIKNVCHVTYQRLLYQQAIIAYYRYDNQPEQMHNFFEKIISVPIMDYTFPKHLTTFTTDETEQYQILFSGPQKEYAKINFDQVQKDINLLTISQMTYCRIHNWYAQYLMGDFIFDSKNRMEETNGYLLKARTILENLFPIISKMIGPQKITMIHEHWGLRATLSLKFLEMEKAEIFMERCKAQEIIIGQYDPHFVEHFFWHKFREWAQTYLSLFKNPLSSFYQNSEILQKVLENLNLCLEYNNSHLDIVMAITFAETYILLNQLDNVPFYLDHAFEGYSAQYSHCSPSVRTCYEIYAQYYEKTEEKRKYVKCLTKIWKITSLLNDKCSCYVKKMEENLEKYKNVKGKWKLNFLKRCSNKRCDKRETKLKQFKKCARCEVTYYCSQTQQKIDWKKAGHKQKCKSCDHN